MSFQVKKLHTAAKLPARQSEEAAGLDVYAAEATVLQPGRRGLVPCGFAMALAKGFEAQVRPRSGLAFKHGVTVLNAPGTIDSDYRGEVKVLLINHGEEPFRVEVGMRIAQLVITPVLMAEPEVVENLQESERGSGGFGSTGE